MSAVKYILLFLLTIGVLAFFLLRGNMPESIAKMFQPVSVVSKVISDGKLDSTDGRTNILLIGVDSRSGASHAQGGTLTDTLMVVSIDEDGKRPVMVSIPRDLWIEEMSLKINAMYSIRRQYYRNVEKLSDEEATTKAIEDLKKAVTSIVGIPIHYYAVVGFDAFKDAIAAVDNVEITVDETFDDYEYPIEGKEDDPIEANRYQHIHYDAGRQIMDGETALKYARSRHSTNANEAGDFARARRQQKVILALKDKILSAETLFNPIKLKELYDSYKENVTTNIELPQVTVFYDKYKDIKLGEVSRIVISNESTATNQQPGAGTLVSLSKDEWIARYGPDKQYQYVLTPVNRTFDQIKSIVRQELFKDDTTTAPAQ
jgi:LCP family protein required for cell wall assembly